MSDWGWVSFAYIVVYTALITYVVWNTYQLRSLRREAALPVQERTLAGADITAPRLEHLEEQK